MTSCPPSLSQEKEDTAGDASTWTEHTVSTSEMDVRAIQGTDVDGDAPLLVAVFGDGKIAWCENEGQCTPACTWTEHIVDDTFSMVNGLSVADLDGDGDPMRSLRPSPTK